MSDFTNLFISPRAQRYKTTFTVDKKDWDLIEEVFPEVGVKNYLPGLLVHNFCEQLRQQQITTFHARFGHTDLATIPGLVSYLNSSFGKGG